MVPFTFLPSGALPPRVSGSYEHRNSTISPSSSLITALHVTKNAYRNRTSLPGARRKNFFEGSSMKSSSSIQISLEKGISRCSCLSELGLFNAGNHSIFPSGKFSITTFRGFNTASLRSAL